MATLKKTIPMEEFLKYKALNRDLPHNLTDFCGGNKNKPGRNNNWKKQKSTMPDNWLLNNKANQTDDEKIYSQIRSMLNKLSDNNFDSIAKDITIIGISNSEHLIRFTEILFNKAIIEQKFTKVYACLARELVAFSVKDDDKVFYFRESLINRCQKMFNDCISITDEPTSESSDTSKPNVTKETAIGCMTFIGELFLLDLLTTKIINSCFLLLLMKIQSNKTHIVDCICTLLKVVHDSFMVSCPAEYKNILDKINKLVASETLQNKDKFALMDIIDLANVQK
jgi:translation initiation factor 4G